MIKRVLFAGTPDYACPSLQVLIDRSASFELAVLSQPDRPRGRGRILSPTPVKKMALDAGLTVWTPETKSEVADTILAFDPDWVVVIAYGMILPARVTDAFPCVNLHGSLLPAYRGASPMQASLLNGDAETGVTLIEMTEKMDAGPMLLKKALPLQGHETLGDVHDALSALSAEVLVDYWTQWMAGNAPQAAPQDHDQATYCRKLTREDWTVSLTDPPLDIYRKIKAFSPHPGVTLTLSDGQVIKLVDADWRDATLQLTRVKPSGKAVMSYHDYLLAHPPIF